MTDDRPLLASKPQIIEAILTTARQGLEDAPIDPELISAVGIEVKIRQAPPAEPVTIRVVTDTYAHENPEVVEVSRPRAVAAESLAQIRKMLEQPPRLGCELNAHRDLGFCELCTPEGARNELAGWRLLAIAQRGVPPQLGVVTRG